jgi:divalent metal cation (Fe/Co/Zn/Cd) transporter
VTRVTSLVRTLIGLALGLFLFFVGIPVLQSLVKHWGYYDNFTFEQAALAFLLVIACVVAAQLTALKPPSGKE